MNSIVLNGSDDAPKNNSSEILDVTLLNSYSVLEPFVSLFIVYCDIQKSAWSPLLHWFGAIFLSFIMNRPPTLNMPLASPKQTPAEQESEREEVS